jgi:glycosyltransferase involved in cell wall biosynthesis
LKPIRLLVVEPWFASGGHMPQTTLNLARILGEKPDVAYFVSRDERSHVYEQFLAQLRSMAEVVTMPSRRPTRASETARALLHLARLPRRYRDADTIFFLDSHLLALVLLWPLVRRRLGARRLAILHLHGPEQIEYRVRATGSWYPRLERRFLERADVRFFLRTDELVEAWREQYPDIPPERFGRLPSLELPDDRFSVDAPKPEPALRVGVIGQLRRGKGLEWLVPLFDRIPRLGTLTVAGGFGDEALFGPLIRPLVERIGGRVGYLPEAEAEALAAAQHYQLVLYDQWDLRQEAATLYLAARVNRPVITYDEGWAGRMVRKYGCGVLVDPEGRGSPDFIFRMPGFFASLPRPGSAEYDALLAGVTRFRDAHRGSAVRDAFLQALLQDPESSPNVSTRDTDHATA